jgi:hypothetical protein
MVCCDTCPFTPTCEEIELEESDWGEEYERQDWPDDPRLGRSPRAPG